MLKITFKSGRRAFVEEVDEGSFPPPPGIEASHWTRFLEIEGDDLEGLTDQ
jgi:hypothetical protein